MTPGEIHGLHKQVVDDLKAQLAAAREDASNERTRAEAAEAELSAEKQRGNSAWDDGYAKGKARAEAAEQELRSERSGEWVEKSHHAKLAIYAGKLQDKLAAIRAHLAGVRKDEIEKAIDHFVNKDYWWMDYRVFAAAREALEP